MTLHETKITQAIVNKFFKKLSDNIVVDVAIAGAGPSGLIAASELAKKGYKVAIFEKKLAPGGGLWGGGMLFNEIVVDEIGKDILEEYGVACEKVDDLYTACSVETTSALIYHAVKNGATLFNTVVVEDVVLDEGKMAGFVINWTPVAVTKLHVDPICIEAKVCLEATGHPIEIVHKLCNKNDVQLFTPSGGVEGERSMQAEKAEQLVVENTTECFPNLFVSGMGASATFGSPRMGPIFGGMLASGKKVAKLIEDKLS